ncbi:MAG: TerC/Alx family metal homeostasis membrane protein [Bacteroidales bacterium]|nr:TerC/Alx family metal homeostasis membrane protein [Bacteroidales bacterium]
MNNLFFIIFMIFVVVMLALDLTVFHRKDHVVGVKEAALQTAMWVALAMGFAALLYFHAEWVHGVSMTASEKHEIASQFIAGYFLEESLSIDNIFVMIMIFVSFGIKKEYYHRVLFWGIFGAIVLRFIFIFALGALVTKFSWLLAVFGVILIYSGIKMFRPQSEEQIDTANHPVVKFASKHFPVTKESFGHDFFHKDNTGKVLLTPLFLVLLVIEFSDIIFAVDSIPAVFSVTTDPVIVYTSNIFAIMGLRSLFFLLSDIADRFWLLHYGLGALLTFIGLKMIGGEFFDWHIDTLVSLAVILGILVFSIVLSMLIKKPVKHETIDIRNQQ